MRDREQQELAREAAAADYWAQLRDLAARCGRPPRWLAHHQVLEAEREELPGREPGEDDDVRF